LNGKRAKSLRRRADQLGVEWPRPLLNEDEAANITLDNYTDFLPEEEYFYAQGQRRRHAMTPRYIQKKLKKNPNATLQELTPNGA